jgi:hypothetical protein
MFPFAKTVVLTNVSILLFSSFQSSAAAPTREEVRKAFRNLRNEWVRPHTEKYDTVEEYP